MSICRQNNAIDDHILKWLAYQKVLPIKQSKYKTIRESGQAPSAIKSAGKFFFKFFSIFKGIMVLRIGHGTGIEPAVEHFRNSSEHLSIFSKRQVIDKMAMKVSYFASVRAFKFCNTPDRYNFSIIRSPKWNRRPPIAVSAD